MSRHGFAVAYDSKVPADNNHSIDVEALAPALLAFGRLIREANAEFNGKRATAKVVVVSDFEAKCFHVNFDVLLNFVEHVRNLLGTSDAATAKAVLQWLGLVRATAKAGVDGTLSYLDYLQWKRGRKVQATTVIDDHSKSGVVEVRVEGDGNTVQVHNHIYKLSENPRALRATRDAFLPLGRDGFDVVDFKDGDKTIERLDTAAVEEIVASCNVGIEEAKETEPEIQVTPAWLSVYSPVFDVTAPNWRFKLGTDIIYADISETQIAAEALARGGVNTNDAYQVRLEITTPVDHHGKEKAPQYKILEVVRFVPAQQTHQGSLF